MKSTLSRAIAAAAVLIWFGLLTIPRAALATQILGEGTIVTNREGGSGYRSVEEVLLIQLVIGGIPIEGPVRPFGERYWPVTEDLEGEELFRLQSGDPAFDLVARLLSNGTNDPIGIGQAMLDSVDGALLGGGGGGGTEAELFFRDPTGAAGVDFSGFAISSVALRVDDLFLDSPGRDPNGNGIWTQPSLTATIVVRGDVVPEPSTGALLGAGLLFLSRRRRRIHRPTPR